MPGTLSALFLNGHTKAVNHVATPTLDKQGHRLGWVVKLCKQQRWGCIQFTMVWLESTRPLRRTEKATTAAASGKNMTLELPKSHNIPKGLYHDLRAPQGQALGWACFQSHSMTGLETTSYQSNWPRLRGTWLDKLSGSYSLMNNSIIMKRWQNDILVLEQCWEIIMKNISRPICMLTNASAFLCF